MRSILKWAIALNIAWTVQFLAPVQSVWADQVRAQPSVNLQSPFWSWQSLELAKSILSGSVQMQPSADTLAAEQSVHILFEANHGNSKPKLLRGLDIQPLEFYKLAYRIPDLPVFTAAKVQLRLLFQQHGLHPPTSLSQNLDPQVEAHMLRFIQDQTCLEWLTNSN